MTINVFSGFEAPTANWAGDGVGVGFEVAARGGVSLYCKMEIEGCVRIKAEAIRGVVNMRRRRSGATVPK